MILKEQGKYSGRKATQPPDFDRVVGQWHRGKIIAGLILIFVATYELIQMLIDRNNLHDLDYWIFSKWIFQTWAKVPPQELFDFYQSRHQRSR